MLRFIVDGNNLLHVAQAHDPLRPPGRSQLCQLLGLWVRRRPAHRRLTIVFDGPEPQPARRQQIRDRSVAVHFSGTGATADEVLIRIIRGDGTPRTLVVVSSDRAIRRVAGGRGARPVRSDEFWSHVQRELARPPRRRLRLPPEKLEGLTPQQTEQWLRELGLEDGQAG